MKYLALLIIPAKMSNRFFRYAPLFFWIILIFVLSSNLGSMSNTSKFILPFLKFLFPEVPEEVLKVYHGYIRKTAHVTEYAILAWLAARAFISSSVYLLNRAYILSSFLLVLTVASLDEFQQSFLASRTASPKDVMLDVFGGILSLVIFYLVYQKRS
ncbi:MAG: VanZ family protein [Acidobacteria bacterium]|nr:MAG: VanZ family protein [Acidobacteriota bacterium]